MRKWHSILALMLVSLSFFLLNVSIELFSGQRGSLALVCFPNWPQSARIETYDGLNLSPSEWANIATEQGDARES